MAKRVLANIDKTCEVGNLVLLQDGVKCELWPLGRIKEVHLGQDGIVFVIDVHSKTRASMRPFMKVYPLKECYVDKVPQARGNVTESTSDIRS